MNSSSLADELAPRFHTLSAERNFTSEDVNGSASPFLTTDWPLNYTKYGEDERIIGEIYRIIKSYYVPFIVIMGVAGNNLIGAVLFFTPLKFRPSSYFISSLAIADTFFLLNLFCYYLQEFAPVESNEPPSYCKFHNYVHKVCSSLSIWYTVGYTIERYIAVQYPTLLDSMRTPLRTKVAIGGLTTAITFIYLHIFLINDEHCNLIPEYLDFASRFFVAETFLTFLVPFLTILTMNFLIVRQLVNLNPSLLEGDGEFSNDTITTASYRGRSSHHSSNVSTSGDCALRTPTEIPKDVQTLFQLSDVRGNGAAKPSLGTLSSFVGRNVGTATRMLLKIKKINCANNVDGSKGVACPLADGTTTPPTYPEILMNHKIPEVFAPQSNFDHPPSGNHEVIKAKVKIYEIGKKMRIQTVAVCGAESPPRVGIPFWQESSAKRGDDAPDLDAEEPSRKDPSTQISFESDSSLPQSTTPSTTLNLYDSSNESFKCSRMESPNGGAGPQTSSVQSPQTSKPSSSEELSDSGSKEPPSDSGAISPTEFGLRSGTNSGDEEGLRRDTAPALRKASGDGWTLSNRINQTSVRLKSPKPTRVINFKRKGEPILEDVRMGERVIPSREGDKCKRSLHPNGSIELSNAQNLFKNSSLRNEATKSTFCRNQEESGANPRSYTEIMEIPSENSDVPQTEVTPLNNLGLANSTDPHTNQNPPKSRDIQLDLSLESCGNTNVTKSSKSFIRSIFRRALRPGERTNPPRSADQDRPYKARSGQCASYRQIKKYHNTTLMLIITSSVFLALHFPNRALRTYATFSNNSHSHFLFFLIDVCDQIDFLHYSINFFLYCFSGSSFRGDTKKLLKKAKCCCCL